MKTQSYAHVPQSLSEAYELTAQHSHTQWAYAINLMINFNIFLPSTSKVILETSSPHVLREMFCTNIGVLFHPSIHIWRYSPFRALVSIIRRLHSFLPPALLFHSLMPSSCNASIWTTTAHLVLGLPTGLVA